MNDDLRSNVRSALPSDVASLMDRIESFAEMPIRVEMNPNPISETDPNPMAPATAVNHDKATIYLRSETEIEPEGVLHELLHIHRYWVEGVPQIMPIGNDANQWSVTSSIENALEHLIIVPKESEYGFDPFPYWNETARINWGRYPWPEMTNEFARRKNVLLGRLGLCLVSDPNVVELAKDCINQEGLQNDAEKFNARIASFIMSNKVRAISCVCRFLNIPIADAHLVTFDVRSRRRIEAPIPPH